MARGAMMTQRASVNGASLAFDVRGSGPPLVLVMGYRLNSSAWPAEFVEGLAERFTLVLFDNRGTGLSDKPTSGYALSNMADDVLGLMDCLGIARSNVLGYSMGGAIAQELVCRHPNRVSSLVLFATLCGGTRAAYADASVMRVMHNLEGLTPAQAARRIWVVTYEPNHLAANRDKIERQMQLEIESPTPLHAADLQFQALVDFDSSTALPGVRAPTLVVTGDRDRLIPPRNSEVIADLIPGAQLIVLRGRGHRAIWEAPAQCTALVADFLENREDFAHDFNTDGSLSVGVSPLPSQSKHFQMIERFVFETLRYYGPPLQWPFLSFEAVAGVVRNVNHPVFRGRNIRYGDGKPLLLVPGHLAGDLTLVPLAMWLRAIGYRPTRLDVPINWDDRLLDKSLAVALPDVARRVGRKAVIVAFGTGVRTALRVAAVEQDHVSDVIALGLPDQLPPIPKGVRLHVVGRTRLQPNVGGELRIVEGSDILLHINPKALQVLSEILREIPISLLESNEHEVRGRSRRETSSVDASPSQS